MDKKHNYIPKKSPLWLKRLHLVKKEARGFKQLKGQEGFRQGVALLAFGLQLMEKSGKTRQLTQFAKCDARWARRWRRERGKTFLRSRLSRSSKNS